MLCDLDIIKRRTAGSIIDGHDVVQAGNLVQLRTDWAQLLHLSSKLAAL